MARKKKNTKADRIAARMLELNELYAELSEEKMKLAKPLMENAAFLEVELEDLQKIISENGTVDSYQNGANQYGKKIGSEVQSYNALLKSYNAINNRLADLLPKKREASRLQKFFEGEEASDE